MTEDLRIRTEEWMNLERTTFAQRAIADEFYEKKLMKLIVKEFVKNNKSKVIKPVKDMILSVGTSYEPLVLSISLFKPERILFLYTDKSLEFLEKVIKQCRLPIGRFVRKRVDENSPLDIYQEVKNAYLDWGKPEMIFMDITGGTKAMSVAAAMASAMVNIQLIYIGSHHFMVDFRKPEPGSEFVQYITNPYEVFGDLEIEKALELVKEYNYAGACSKLLELTDKVPDPIVRQQLELIYFLVNTYELWDDLKFEEAYKQISILSKNLLRDSMRSQNLVLLDFMPQIEFQKNCLCKLTEMKQILKEKGNYAVLKSHEHIVPLMFTMFVNAGIREAQGKYDTATLLWYRLLEMISQRRLAKYGINVSQVDYNGIQYDYEQTPEFKGLTSEECFNLYKQKVYDFKCRLFGRQGSAYLPDQIALLEGFVQLSVLKDKLMTWDDVSAMNQVKKIRYMVSLRNRSIYAHGLIPVEKPEYEKFKNYVLMMFQHFCVIENVNTEEYCSRIKWINPQDSKNYSF